MTQQTVFGDGCGMWTTWDAHSTRTAMSDDNQHATERTHDQSDVHLHLHLHLRDAPPPSQDDNPSSSSDHATDEPSHQTATSASAAAVPTPKGASPAESQLPPTHSAELPTRDISTADRCIICQDALESDIVATPCGHVFHQPCLERWLGEHDDCPLCRWTSRTGFTTTRVITDLPTPPPLDASPASFTPSPHDALRARAAVRRRARDDDDDVSIGDDDSRTTRRSRGRW